MDLLTYILTGTFGCCFTSLFQQLCQVRPDSQMQSLCDLRSTVALGITKVMEAMFLTEFCTNVEED